MAAAHRAPAHLDARGRGFWRAVTTDYELRPDELRVLEDACRELDLIERLDAEQRDTALTVPGSHGQPVAAPLLGELRAHRALLARLLNQLRLPD
ncbi:MAG: hypothetical protein L0I76_24920, partial [Pseudonocardia sp.]|nr:hypothetical protein [Pseudonocardia sp.]